MKYTVVTPRDKLSSEYCEHFPDGLVKCDNYHSCYLCTLADRIRATNAQKDTSLILFDNKNCLRQTPSGGGENFYNKPIVLTEKAMKRLHIEQSLFNQMAIAFGGAGCFPKNKASAIDCYLLSDPERVFIISRYETYGIPDMRAVEKYEELFFMGLRRYFS